MKEACLPSGYRAIRGRGSAAFVWESAASWAEAVLEEAGSFYDWGSARAQESRAGRGPVHIVEAAARGPDAADRWAVRRYRRGGAAAALLGEQHWGFGFARPGDELVASLRARAAGVRTPAVVAGAVYRHGARGAAGFYRADLVTEHVPRTRTLAATLIQGGLAPERALASAGSLARDLGRAGVLHVDFNAANVLLEADGTAWVLDLDRARVQAPSARLAVRMVGRLERSLRKLERTHARSFTFREWAHLHAVLDVE